MRSKSVFLLLACICGTIAAIGVSQWMQAQNAGQNAIQMVEIFVTTKTIDVAEEITADKIRLEQWPADRIPEGSTSELEEIEGKFARQRFYAGEPVMPVKLMNDANGTSQTIPKGYSVVSMKADPENAVANLVRPGDRVDVMAYFTKSDIIPESMAKTVLKGVRVFAIDGRTERDDSDSRGTVARTISLLIHSKDAEAWTYASELGKIRLTLGNPGDYADSNGSTDGNDAAKEFLTWLADHQRAQEARLKEKAKAAEQTASPAPAERTVVVEPKRGNRMLKIANGKLTEYEFIDGQMVPVVVSETGNDAGDPSSVPEPVPGELESPVSDYSYLNGPTSPFFQPAGRSGPVGSPGGNSQAPSFPSPSIDSGE